MASKVVFISTAAVDLASISISQIPSLQTYFLLVSNLHSILFKSWSLAKEKRFLKPKTCSLCLYFCPSACPSAHGTLGEWMNGWMTMNRKSLKPSTPLWLLPPACSSFSMQSQPPSFKFSSWTLFWTHLIILYTLSWTFLKLGKKVSILPTNRFQNNLRLNECRDF